MASLISLGGSMSFVHLLFVGVDNLSQLYFLDQSNHMKRT